MKVMNSGALLADDHHERHELTEQQKTRRRVNRYRAIRQQLLNDRGGDPSQAQVLLAENAAGLAVHLEMEIEKMIKREEKIELGPIGAAMNTLKGLLTSLGIERQPKDVTTLQAYLDGKVKEAESTVGYSKGN